MTCDGSDSSPSSPCSAAFASSISGKEACAKFSPRSLIRPPSRRARSDRGSPGLPGLLVFLRVRHRPSEALNQLGRVMIAGQVLGLNVLRERHGGAVLVTLVADNEDRGHKLFLP